MSRAQPDSHHVLDGKWIRRKRLPGVFDFIHSDGTRLPCSLMAGEKDGGLALNGRMGVGARGENGGSVPAGEKQT